MTYCVSPAQDRRRIFWTTQPSACGVSPDNCSGGECGTPGLFLTGNFGQSRTIATNDWLRSLIINILSTRGRQENQDCGHAIGAQGGHWSDSFRKDGQQAGNLIYTVGMKRSYTEAALAVAARVQADMHKLVLNNVVKSIDVVAEYIGGGRMSLKFEVRLPTGETSRVGLTGERSQNAWMWS